MRMEIVRCVIGAMAVMLCATCDDAPEDKGCPGLGVVDPATQVGMYASTGGFGDQVFTSYYDQANGDLKLAHYRRQTGAWTIETLDEAGDVGMFSSLAVAGPMVYVSYYDKTRGQLKVAVNDGYGEAGRWRLHTVAEDSADDMGLHSAVAAADGRIYVSYHNATQLKLGVARSDDSGATWSLHVPDDGRVLSGTCARGRFGLFTSVSAVGGAVHVAYYDESPGCEGLLWAGSQDRGDTWERKVVIANDPTGMTGRKPGVATYGELAFRSHAILARTPENVTLAYTVNGNEASGESSREIHLAQTLDAGAVWKSSAFADAFHRAEVREVAVGSAADDLFVQYYDAKERIPYVHRGAYLPGGEAALGVETDQHGQLLSVKPLAVAMETGRFGSFAILDGGLILFTFYDEANQQLDYACANYKNAAWPRP